MNQRRLRILGVGLTVAACAMWVLAAEQHTADVNLFGKKKTSSTPTSIPNEPDGLLAANSSPLAQSNAPSAKSQASEKPVKLNYLSKTWNDVLQDVAKQSGRTLVIDKVPPGRFSRNDWNRYSLNETLRILNRELEPKGFRLLDRGQYLDLTSLRDMRNEYQRPVMPLTNDERTPTQEASSLSAASNGDDADTPRTARSNSTPPTTTKKPTPPRRLPPETKSATRVPPRRGDQAILLANHNDLFEDDDNGDEAGWDLESFESQGTEVELKRQSARQLSRTLYEAFLPHAELIEDGPGGLPGFLVWTESPPAAARGSMKDKSRAASEATAKRRPRFAIGIDTKDNRLRIDGSQTEVTSAKRLISKLDVVTNRSDRSVRLIASNRDVRDIANALRPAVKQLAQRGEAESGAASGEEEKKPPAKSTTKKKKAAKQPNATKKSDETAMPDDNQDKPAAPDSGDQMPPFIGGLKGDVNVEALEDMGLFIIRGNEADVEAVMNVIRQIEKLSAGTTPEIHVRMLEHVDSESLSELITSVYERLTRSRGRPGEQVTQKVTVIAVGKPNAVIILASKTDIAAVEDLIDKLDQPVDPATEFEVFRLRYAIASQVVTTLDSFFSGRTGGTTAQAPAQGQSTTTARSGLGGRVKSISDSRTNTVIVQARPRDLEEVARLIGELDQVGSKSASQIKLIPLKSALADEMAELLNLAIQSTISPPQQVRSTQGGQGASGGAGGGGQTGQIDQKLREAKSAVLQFLEGEDGEQLVESGILADIRINADPRTNSLVVTAPEESLALIEALVKRFDQPSAMVAEIKHFTLQNADASSVVTMLNQLFNDQQQAGQRGGANQQNQQLGIQLAGAEDASSQLIPLRFSTDVRTNSIIAVGGAEALSVVEAIILRLDASDMRQRKSTVYRLKNSPAQEVANAITLFLQGQRDLANQGNQNLISDVEQLERQVIVVAEPNSNSLLISATPRYFEDIQEMITRIDEAKPEVVIQALLVEVTLDNTDEFGIELGFQDKLLFNRGTTAAADITTVTTTNQPTTVGGTTTTSQDIISQALTPGFLFNTPTLGNNVNSKYFDPSPGTVAGQGLSNFAVGRTNGNLGFGGLVLSAGSESVNVLLRALSATRKIEILSRPQIRTLDNQRAFINVGQEVPYVSGASPSTGISGGFVPTISRDQSGIVLAVEPRITPDDRIVILVHAERSKYDLTPGAGVTLVQASAGAGAITSPVKDISVAESTVSVANEQTIVMGGLIQKTNDEITRKVPWLGDLPILGHAFRYDSKVFRRTELLIFLTPRIVKNNTVSEIIKQIEAERLHYTEAEAEAIHGPLFCAPAPPSDGSTPSVYAPGDFWTPPAGATGNAPPAPAESNVVPQAWPQDSHSPQAPQFLPPLPPMNDASGGVNGASYQQTVDFNAASTLHSTQPVAGSRKSKAEKKPTILNTFRRDKTGYEK